jgi:hypothetical protein
MVKPAYGTVEYVEQRHNQLLEEQQAIMRTRCRHCGYSESCHYERWVWENFRPREKKFCSVSGKDGLVFNPPIKPEPKKRRGAFRGKR